MGTGMGTEAAISRKANVFSSFGKWSFAGVLVGPRPIGFGSLFSGVYGEENNCMSGIAMFMLPARDGWDSAKGRGICHY